MQDNPSARLVRALDGQVCGRWSVIGRVIEVSYGPGIDAVLAAVDEVEADAVLGFGVLSGGGVLRVERTGRAVLGSSPDVRGAVPGRLDGPSRVGATVDVESLAAALECAVSDDAGGYVCNAWLHQVVQRTSVPAAFVHIPPEGVDVARVVNALAGWLPSVGD